MQHPEIVWSPQENWLYEMSGTSCIIIGIGGGKLVSWESKSVKNT